MARIAAKHATSPYVVALAWLLGSADHIVPIPGASKPASARSSLTAANLTLDSADRTELDALGRRGH